MASLLEEYHKQAHEQSAQFGFEATCKTPVQLAQSNIEIKHIIFFFIHPLGVTNAESAYCAIAEVEIASPSK